MSKGKLSSVDWLISQLWTSKKTKKEWQIIEQKAKQMHKQEIISAFENGIEISYIEMQGDRTLFIKPVDTFLDAENYYNQTFGENNK